MENTNNTNNVNNMNNMNKYQKSAIVLVVVIIILLIISLVVSNGNSNGSNMTDDNNASSTAMGNEITGASSCGLAVTSIDTNEAVTFPITVTGNVDNTNSKNLGCRWQMFEGQAGSAQLYYQEGSVWTKISSQVPVTVADWMSDKTTFSAKFPFQNKGEPLPAGTKMKIVFTEDNASGTGTVDKLEFPITVK
jgi:hypothetical protein